MRIVSVTVTYNEGYLLDFWYSYYLQYKSSLYAHIIVDNNSDEQYQKRLRTIFTNSDFIIRNNNGGVTSAFNDGIKLAIDKYNAEYILLICPDISTDSCSILNLASELKNNAIVGVCAPILFKNSNSLIIECFGGEISKYYAPIYNYENIDFNKVELPEYLDVSFVPGGINMAKVEVYEKVGFQDESLFMYSDEVDWEMRVSKMHYKIRVVKKSQATHKHINPTNSIYRSNLAYFLINRNILLLAWKYGNWVDVLKTFLILNKRCFYQILGMLKRNEMKKVFSLLLGLFYGLLNSSKIPSRIVF